MRTLVIMRHAKAENGSSLTTDFDRLLNERGKLDAEEMGRRLKHKKFTPDFIVCSAAKRTTKTAKLVAEQLEYSPDTITKEYDLYEASINDVMHVLRQLNDEHKHVILVGHNPSVTSLVGYLSDTQIEGLPTAGQACITFSIQSWKQLATRQGELHWVDFPKNE